MYERNTGDLVTEATIFGFKIKLAKIKQIWDWFYHNKFADYGEPVESFVFPEDYLKILLMICSQIF